MFKISDILTKQGSLLFHALVSSSLLAADLSCHWTFYNRPNWIHICAQISLHVCTHLCVHLFICSHIAAVIQPRGKMCF